MNEYNNTYHTTIKMNPVDVKDNAYINFKKEVNDKGPTFKVGEHVRNSKYKNIFDKGYTSNWLQLKIQSHGHMLLRISMVKKLFEHSMKKNNKRLINNNLGSKK